MEISILQSKIYEVRGQKVMLDFDLALLYKVGTRVLNQAVKRNINRFPEDFMFQLTLEELENMSSQSVTTYPSKRPKTSLPFAFTELRRYALENKDFNSKLLEIERKYDKQFSDIYEALNFLIKRDENEAVQKERKQIGYKK